jgi:hypothetical protein
MAESASAKLCLLGPREVRILTLAPIHEEDPLTVDKEALAKSAANGSVHGLFRDSGLDMFSGLYCDYLSASL